MSRHGLLGLASSTISARLRRQSGATRTLILRRTFSLLPSSLHVQVEALVAQTANICSVPPDEVVDIYPCTPTQRFLIARTLACPNAYWLLNVLKIPAQMDTARLEKAWEQVGAAHAILRS